MRKKYMLFICAFFIAVCVFLFMSFYDIAKHEAIKNLNIAQVLHAKQAAQGIEDFFANWTKILTVLSETEHIKNMDKTGQESVESLYGNNTELIRSITRVDAKGRVIYTAPYDGNAIGKDISSQKHIREIMETRRPVISDVFFSVQGYNTIALHVPIFTNGTYKGTIGIAVNFQSLAKRYLEAIKIGKTGYAWVISRDGTELFCPVPGHTGKSVFENCKDYPSILAMAEDMLKKREGITTYSFDKIRGQKVDVVNKHAIFMPIIIGNTFWSVVVASSEDEILSSLVGFRNRLVMVIGVLLLGGILFSYYGLKAWFIVREEGKRRQIEGALKESESKFRVLAENSTSVIFVIQEDKYIYINPAFTAATGYTLEDLASMNFWDLISPDMRELIKTRGIARQNRENISPHYDLKFLTKSGAEKYGSFSAAFIEFQHKPAILGTVLDVTERKRMEDALRDSEEKYRNIFENAVMGIFQSTPEGRVLNANPALASICGYDSPREMIDALTDIGTQLYVHPEDRKWIKELLQKQGFAERFETQFYRKDGGIVWVSMNVHIVKDSAGSITFYEGILGNITVRKQAEEDLRATHQRLSDIIEFLPDATFVIDDKKKVVAWNRACEEMTGVRKEEIIGKGDYAYAVPFYGEPRPILIDYVTIDSDELQQNYMSIRKKGHLLYAEAFIPMLHNGKGTYLSGDASPLFDRTGNVVGAIESIRDVTEFKHLEAQLLHSQKMEAIGTLAGGIAHDFNNILTALMGYATLVQMEMSVSDFLRPYVDEILIASQKAADLTQSLLTFSRQKAVTLAPLDINNTLRITEKLLRRLLTEDIELRTALTQDGAIIMADETQIDQVLFNLATNARDAMPKGGTFTIETAVVTVDNDFIKIHGFGEQGEYVLINISDTGTGIDKATREKIFDPFFTTKEVGKGTGLGLATVYGIVRQHSGYITVESEPNQGTTFSIYFPVTGMKVNEKQDIAVPIITGNETILIAEDDDEVRRFMQKALHEYGYTIIEAIDGEDAIDKFKRNRLIDLIVLDSVMPKKNGREVYEEIRRVAPHVKVLFTSGYTKDIVLNKGIEAGEFNFIAKPLSLNELLWKIRDVLDR
jgi:two-component system cell cycle sensor histidine kinase/response regulator CckA